MEFILSTPLLIFAAVILAIFVILQIYIDTKDIIQSNKIQRELIAIAKKQSEKTFGVIIELSHSAETAIPLLEHLMSQNYSKLVVIILIKKTAGKKSKITLNNFRKVSHMRNLHIIMHSKGLKLENVVRRFGPIDLVMLMKVSQRLSSNFFTLASIGALSMLDGFVMMPRRHLRLGNPMTSALIAQRSILWQQISSLFGAKAPLSSLTDGLIYSQRSLEYDEAGRYSRLEACRGIYISDQVPTESCIEYINQQIDVIVGYLRSRYGLLILMLTIAVASIKIILLGLDLFMILAIIILIMYSLASLTAQLRLRGYKLMENINLILITPFSLMFLIFTYILGFMKYVVLLMATTKN
jgi:hypothetical protein